MRDHPHNPGADSKAEQEATASPARELNRRFDSSDRGHIPQTMAMQQLQGTGARQMSCARCEEWQRICENLESQITGLREDTADRIAALESALRGRTKVLIQLKASIDTRINDLLCETKPNYDDSIVGINDAWDVVRKACDEYIASAALAPEQDK